MWKTSFLYYWLLFGTVLAAERRGIIRQWLQAEKSKLLHHFWPNFSALQHNIITGLLEREVCYPDLGCVEITLQFFHPLHRPINALPLTRDVINTQFFLHTRNASQGLKLRANDLGSIQHSTFHASRRTIFIIHGYLENGQRPWIKELTQSLLDHGDYNVIVTDWEGGSQPFYAQAVANIRLVGLEIAHLVKTLTAKFNVSPGNVHLIGHSLGAHTAGYAGEKIPGLGRITGLDPAGPGFEWMPPVVRLDPTDATFVDAIHTNAKPIYLEGYGMRQPVGHVDFYVNGGNVQPGCNNVKFPITVITSELKEAAEDFIFCNHRRSVALFIDSLNPTCQYIGYECTDYDSYLSGECYSCGRDNSKCAKLGMETEEYPFRNRRNIQMYLTSKAERPYCTFHYSVKIVLAKSKNDQISATGILRISVYGDKYQQLEKPLSTTIETFVYGEEKRYLLILPADVGNVQRIELKWNGCTDNPTVNSSTCSSALYITTVEISALDHYPESNRLAFTRSFCGVDPGYVEVADGTVTELVADSCATYP